MPGRVYTDVFADVFFHVTVTSTLASVPRASSRSRSHLCRRPPSRQLSQLRSRLRLTKAGLYVPVNTSKLAFTLTSRLRSTPTSTLTSALKSALTSFLFRQSQPFSSQCSRLHTHQRSRLRSRLRHPKARIHTQDVLCLDVNFSQRYQLTCTPGTTS